MQGLKFVSHQIRRHNERISVKGHSTPRDFSRIGNYKLNLWCNIFWGFLYFLQSFLTQAAVVFGLFSLLFYSLAEIIKSISQITYDDFTRFSILKNIFMYENYYHDQLAKIVWNIPLMLIVDVFCRDTFSRFFFGNINSRDYDDDSLNVMFSRFLNCFLPVSLVFPHVSPGVSTVSFGVSAVSPQCFPCLLFCGFITSLW